MERAMHPNGDMIGKILGWLSVAACLALLSMGPSAAAQDTSGERDDFYLHYEGGFDEQADEDDWFYDYYSYAMEPDSGDTFASYDPGADRFDWEEDGLFA